MDPRWGAAGLGSEQFAAFVEEIKGFLTREYDASSFFLALLLSREIDL